MLNPLQLELTRLIGKKELTFGCVVLTTRYEALTIDSCNIVIDNTVWYETGLADAESLGDVVEVIGHPATLPDFHRFLISKGIEWWQDKDMFEELLYADKSLIFDKIRYDSSKDLLDQEESTLEQIISLIKSIEGKY